MDLWCKESNKTYIKTIELVNYSHAMTRAAVDHNLLSDDRVLEQLLQSEHRYIPNDAFTAYKRVQNEVEPHMRKILAYWMLEVCEEQQCEDIVFPLAMNYVDRLLTSTPIKKSQLQLVGSVCLLIASKLRQCNSLHPETLSYFTDYSVTTQEILGWELLVLSRLKWDVSAVVAIDFIDHLLIRLELNNQNNGCTLKEKNINDIIRRHASTFIALCTTVVEFVSHSPSLIAAACIATAINGLVLEHTPWKSFDKLLSTLAKLTNIEDKQIQRCADQIEALIATNAAANLVQQIMSSDKTPYDIEQFSVRQCIKYNTMCDQIIAVNENSIQREAKDIYF